MARRFTKPIPVESIGGQAITGWRFNAERQRDLALDLPHCGLQYDVTTYLETGKSRGQVTRLVPWSEIPEEIRAAVKAIHDWTERHATEAGLYEQGDDASDFN